MKRLGMLFICMHLFNSYAQETASQLEKEAEVVNFENLKDVLKKDMLTEVVEEKGEKVTVFKENKKSVTKSLYNYPSESDFWKFITDIWLVKNASKYTWDFVHPDYGVHSSLETMLENLSLYQIRFKLLYLNSSSIPVMVLPAGRQKEVIFLLSVPFIRSLDLSKREIALLLVESWMRHERGYFLKEIKKKVDLSFLGSNFMGKEIQKSAIESVLLGYTEFFEKRGFQFQEQFEVTKAMDQLLKQNVELWNAYYTMIGKIDNLVKTNLLYKDYNKMYPSPEMQLKWLRPEKKFP